MTLSAPCANTAQQTLNPSHEGIPPNFPRTKGKTPHGLTGVHKRGLTIRSLKSAMGAEDIARGVLVPVRRLPQREPVKAAI